MAKEMILFALTTSVIFYCVSAFLTRGLQRFPGPILAKFSNIWRLIETWKGHYEKVVQNLHSQYGDVVRIGPNILSLRDPEAIESVYGIKADLPKSGFYSVMQRHHNGKLVPTLLTATDKQAHGQLRKPIANIFTMSSLSRFEPLVDKIISDLVDKLRQNVSIESTVTRSYSIDLWLQYFSFDVIGGLSFSRPFGFLEHGCDVDGMMKDLARDFKYCAIVGQMPVLDKFLKKNPLLRWFKAKPNPFSIRAGNLFRSRMLDEKPGTESTYHDFIGRILEIKGANPERIPDEAVIGYIMTILLAGSDTVSITLRSIVYYLAKDPMIQRKLQKEIDNADLTYPVPWKCAQDLKYLDAVVKEALRIHPPTSILLERIVSPVGLTLPNGQELKPGTVVSMNGWTINQNQEVFGKNTGTFDPDRWLQRPEESGECFHNRTNRMKKADLAFGYGTRSCMGKPIAQLEIYKLIPTLFGLFDVRLARPEKEWQYISYFVTEQHDMDVHLHWRAGVDKSMGIP